MANEHSPLKAIKEKCIDCCGGSFAYVKECTVSNCALHPFRFGKNPFNKRKMTEEQRQVAGERLKKARASRVNAAYDEDEEEDDDDECEY